MQKEKVTVVKEFTFDSAHHLPGYPGKCSRPHGHTYRLQVGFTGVPEERTGMVIDFKDIQYMVDAILSKIDHCDLNEVDSPGFPKHMPTAENMVFWFIQHFNFCGLQANLSFVRLWETPDSYVEWYAPMERNTQ